MYERKRDRRREIREIVQQVSSRMGFGAEMYGDSGGGAVD